MIDPFSGLAPANIEAIVPYEPGKPVEELERELGVRDAIKLASNENPIGPSPLGVAAARAALAGANRYPDGAAFRLRAAIAEHLDVPGSHIVVGSGSSELIDLAVRVFCRPGEDEVVTHRYAFVSYKLVSQAHGVVFREVDVAPDLSVDVAALSAAVGPRTKVVFLPNPNNPTGLHLDREVLERFIAKLPPRVLLVVDEAYFEYAEGLPGYASALAFRAVHPLTLCLRTFSKMYGLAALRVGYGIADARVIAYLNRVRPIFNVSTVGQEAARAALADSAHVERSRRANADGREQLLVGLAALPVRAFPSAANFILIDLLGRDAGPIYERLLARGVIVRTLRPQGLVQHIRVTVGTWEENVRFLATLAEILVA